MTERTPYDRELGTITTEDRENALYLLDDLAEGHPSDSDFRIETVAQWFRKVRYEAVIADRKARGHGLAPDRGPGELAQAVLDAARGDGEKPMRASEIKEG